MTCAFHVGPWAWAGHGWVVHGWSEHFVYEFELWRVVVLLSRTSLENHREKTLQTKVRTLTAV